MAFEAFQLKVHTFTLGVSMTQILAGLLIVLTPSLLGVAWLIWRADRIEEKTGTYLRTE